MFFETLLKNLIEWSLTHGIRVAGILITAFILTRVIKVFIPKILKKFIQKGARLTGKEKRLEKERIETLSKVAFSIKKTAIWLIAVLTIMPEFGINIAPLLAGLGVGGLALGLGARNLIQDYIAGIFILLEDQYRIGEIVEIGGVKGKVKEFNLRRTIIENEAGGLTSIPNSQISKSTNLSRKK